MPTYLALVEYQQGSAYGISFPDLPGVFSASDEEEDIIDNAIEALRLWAEDEVLPEPSGQSEVLAQAEIRKALAGGAFLIKVPLIDIESEVVRVNVSFERGVLRSIDEAARRRKQTRAGFLADAARHEIERPLARQRAEASGLNNVRRSSRYDAED